MSIQHGGVVIDIPPTWIDQSTLLFLRPPERLPAARDPAKIDSSTEAVSVSFLGDVSPEEALAGQLDNLRAVDPEATLVSDGVFACGLGAGRRWIQRFHVEGTPMLQLVVACRCGEVTVLASGATSEARFARCERELDRILSSLRPTGGGA